MKSKGNASNKEERGHRSDVNDVRFKGILVVAIDYLRNPGELLRLHTIPG